MPGELSDPEQSQPFHYDTRYENRPRPLELLYPGPDMYIHNIAEQVLNKPLNRYDLARVRDYLGEKGVLHQNWGDQAFRDEVVKILNKIKLARKVVHKCLT